MKKSLILSTIILTLISCSSNDNNLDPFIGTWSLLSVNNQEVDECSKKSTVTVLENGRFIIKSFYEINNECKLIPTVEASWKNKGNRNYGITEPYFSEKVNKVTFNDNNNTYSINHEINGENKIIVYKRKQ